jgi:hypothetical protein
MVKGIFNSPGSKNDFFDKSLPFWSFFELNFGTYFRKNFTKFDFCSKWFYFSRVREVKIFYL